MRLICCQKEPITNALCLLRATKMSPLLAVQKNTQYLTVFCPTWPCGSDCIFLVSYFGDDRWTLHLPPILTVSLSITSHPRLLLHNLSLLCEDDTKAACSQPACLCPEQTMQWLQGTKVGGGGGGKSELDGEKGDNRKKDEFYPCLYFTAGVNFECDK